MANGYIGKISAVVTANTSDLERKLSGAVKNVDVFANRLAASIERSSKSAQDSLNSIFTPLQRLERNLQAGLSGNVFKRDNVEQYVRSVRQAVSISEQINKPLASGAAAFQKLSLEVQAGFLPALNRAQSAAVNLSNTLQQQGGISERTFGGVEQVVNRTTEALRRLGQAQQLAVSGFSGNELQFTSPRAFQALQSAAASTSRAAELPASALADGNIQRQVQRLQQFRNLVAQTVAEVEEIRLRPNVDQTALAAAERRLDNIVETTLRAKAELDRAVKPESRGFVARDVATPARGLGLFGSQAGTDAEAAIEQARRVSAQYAKLPEAARAGISGLAGIAARLSDQVQATGNNAEQLLLVLQRLERQIEATQQPPSQNTGLTLYTPPVEIAATGGDLVKGFQKLKDDRASAASAALGRDIGDPIRQVDSLEGRIGSLKGRIDSLPASIQSQFIPSIKRAQDEFIQLRVLGPAATAEEIEKAAQGVRLLEAGLARASALVDSFGGAGVEGINLGLDQRVLQGFESQLLILQGVIAGVAGEARGDLAAAFDAVRNSITAAMKDGTIATQATQKSITETIKSLAQLSATASNQSIGRVLQQVARAGDVGRQGLDRFSLAAQQAGFAIDDFFSVTGGLDQRLRAVSNNVTQLAFILGGTQGLFIGLAAVIAGQAVVALTKWANSGRTAEDQTKALNDTLARQKSLVESLAESFRELGDSLARGTLSQQAEDARAFAQSIERAAKARREINEENVLENDPVIRLERANQARIDREIAAASDAAVRTGLQAQRDVSEQRVQNRRGVLRLPAPDDFEVEQTLRRRAPNPFRGNVPDLPGGNDLSSLRARREALEQPIDRLRQILADGPSFGDGGLRFGIASQSFDELNSLASRLDAAISDAVDGIATDVVQNARAPAARLADSQQKIAQAVEAGLGGAGNLAALLDQAGGQFRDALEQLNSAVQLDDPAERERAIAEARRSLEAATLSVDAEARKVAAIDETRRALEVFSTALERASQEAQRNLSSAQSAADEARAADLGRSSPASQAARAQAEADVQRQRQLATGVEQEVAAARNRFEEQVRSAQQVALATEARAGGRRLNEIIKPLGIEGDGRPYSEVIEELQAAGEDALAREVQGIASRQQEIEGQLGGAAGFWDKINLILQQGADEVAAELQAAATRIGEIDSLLGTQGVLTEGQREALVRERAGIEQQFVEQDAAVQAAVEESTREEQQRRQAERGRQLAQTPGQQAAEKLASDLDAVRQFFGRQAEEGSGLVDFEAQKAAQDRLIQDAFRSQAPAIAGLADSVANAVLQGPSRAALNATDVSTVEGASELNRLIRGDDAARDQNLEELRRQSDYLRDIAESARKFGEPLVAEN